MGLSKEQFVKELEEFTKKAVEQGDLPEGPEKKIAVAAERAFTDGVNYLRAFPTEYVRLVSEIAYDVIGSQIVKVVLGFSVKVLSFVVIGSSPEKLAGYVLVPQNWLKQIDDDRILQISAIAAVCSLTVDFVNGKYKNPEETSGAEARAMVVEVDVARKLHKIMRSKPTCERHIRLFDECPLDLDSPSVQRLLYKPKTVMFSRKVVDA